MPGGGMNGSPGPSAGTSPVHGQPASLRHTAPRRWHRMPRHLAYDPTGKNIVCHRQNHCMLLAKSLYATGGNIVCRGQRHQTTNHGRSECRDVCLHHARCTVQPERQRTTAIHPYGRMRGTPASPHFTYATSWLIKNKGGGFSLHPVIPPMWSIFFLYVCEPTPRCYRPICLHRADRDKQSGILQHFVIKQLATLQRSLPVAMHRGQAV